MYQQKLEATRRRRSCGPRVYIVETHINRVPQGKPDLGYTFLIHVIMPITTRFGVSLSIAKNTGKPLFGYFSQGLCAHMIHLLR